MASKTMIISFVVNLFLGIFKVLGGIITKSMTLISDGVHCLSDMGTDIVGLVGIKIASKEADETHPFGHGKMEYVTSIFMSLLIIFLAITIFVNSFKPNDQVTNIYATIILFISIIIKIYLSKYLIKKGKELNNEILITNGVESRYDSFSSMFGLIFIILGLLQNSISIFKYADIVGSIIISIFTFKIGATLFIKNIKSVIGEADISEERRKKLEEIVLNNKNILSIKRINILKYGHYNYVIVEVRMDEEVTLKKFSRIEKRIKENIKKFDSSIKYVLVSVEAIKNIK